MKNRLIYEIFQLVSYCDFCKWSFFAICAIKLFSKSKNTYTLDAIDAPNSRKLNIPLNFNVFVKWSSKSDRNKHNWHISQESCFTFQFIATHLNYISNGCRPFGWFSNEYRTMNHHLEQLDGKRAHLILG